MSNVIAGNFNADIRENKLQTVCECGSRHFKLVVYPRNINTVYLECVQCERAYAIDDEVADLRAYEWT